jgi:UDP-3-O-[3-hydroxymyristoyl] glucosamine N-acyltransferase
MTLGELARRIGVRLEVAPGAPGTSEAPESAAEERIVRGCAAIDRAGPDDVAFLANIRYARHLQTTQAAAVLIDERTACPPHVNRLIADDPYFAFRNAMIELHGFRQHPQPIGGTIATPSGAVISAQAAVHPDAQIGEGTAVHPFAVVEAGAVIGRECVIYPGAYVGHHTRIGDQCVLHPNVAVYEHCTLGDRVILHSSTVIGHDGFGYATHKGEHHKIPQHGIVVIEDDVELGGGCAVERAAMGETRIGRGTKFADLISIGHGTTIGAHCLLVSLVGISGSVEVGDYVVLGGQVGVAGHLKIGSGVQAMARTAIARDIEPGQKVGGAPAVPADIARRNAMASLDLAELVKRVRQLERELADLKGEAAERPKVQPSK